MNQEQIDRINALYRKSKAEGLTEEEKKEQALLRKQYVADVKKNLAAQLNNIDMVNPDGSVENLGDKYGKKTGISRRSADTGEGASADKGAAQSMPDGTAAGGSAGKKQKDL